MPAGVIAQEGRPRLHELGKKSGGNKRETFEPRIARVTNSSSRAIWRDPMGAPVGSQVVFKRPPRDPTALHAEDLAAHGHPRDITVFAMSTCGIPPSYHGNCHGQPRHRRGRPRESRRNFRRRYTTESQKLPICLSRALAGGPSRALAWELARAGRPWEPRVFFSREHTGIFKATSC